MKYFIMGWNDDSEEKRYNEFYFVGDKLGNVILFSSIEDAEFLGRKTCKYSKICSWHDYIIGDNIIEFNKLELKEVEVNNIGMINIKKSDFGINEKL